MGIVHENTNFHGIETLQRREIVHWEKKSGGGGGGGGSTWLLHVLVT